MDRGLSHDQLVNSIKLYAKQALAARQVVSRLERLLPMHLRHIKNGYTGRYKGAKAERMALVDESYQAMVEQYMRLLHDAMEARMQWETHMMLLDCRRSLRKGGH